MKSLAKLFKTKQKKLDGRDRCYKEAIFFKLEGKRVCRNLLKLCEQSRRAVYMLSCAINLTILVLCIFPDLQTFWAVTPAQVEH